MIIIGKDLKNYLEDLKAFAIKYNLKFLIEYIDHLFNEDYFNEISYIESKYPEIKILMNERSKFKIKCLY